VLAKPPLSLKAIALAVFYKIPILVRKNLLQETMKA